MLVEDTAAFVERLEVTPDVGTRHRRRMARADLAVHAGQLEVHLAASAALELERRIRTEISPRRVRSLERELRGIRRHLDSKRAELAASLARRDRLEAHVHELSQRRSPHVTFRLHSMGHHSGSSEKRFAQLSARQLQRPVRVLRSKRGIWWWYLNRCWWDPRGLRPSEVADLVLRADLERMRETDGQARTRLALVEGLGEAVDRPPPASLHLSIWSKHRGRCVDCGSTERVNFDRILATSRPNSETPQNFDLRCQSCRDRRDHNESRARVGRARVDADLYQRFG